jgi:glycosyltransferase involved in cell wall biosynthesis
VGCIASLALRLDGAVRLRRKNLPALIVTKRTDFSPRRGRLTKLRYARLVDRVTAVSGAARLALIEAGIPPEKIEVIYSSVDCDHFRPAAAADLRTQPNIPREALVVGTVGHLTPRKGQHLLLEAAPSILQKVPQAYFLFCGEGNFRPRLEEMAARLGVSERVQFLGFMSDVRPVLQTLDVFVLASLREGLGVALLEAMAMGKPVVASNAGGIAEAVRPGKTGVLVPPGDVKALSEAVAALLLDAPAREKMGEAARLRAQSIFSLPVMVERTEKLYLDILSARPR